MADEDYAQGWTPHLRFISVHDRGVNLDGASPRLMGKGEDSMTAARSHSDVLSNSS